MIDPNPGERTRLVVFKLVLMATFVILCGFPYLRWLEHPSLFHDDFLRVESLRNSTLQEALFRPFNEHMAPLFETVSYLAWLAAGRRITALPTAFMAASFLAFGATTGMLWALIRRETGSKAAALVAVALFTLSSVSAETVLWYSASSFQWAAAATLASWYCAASAADDRSPRARPWWLAGALAASFAAPAFSAIGMLAAPLAMLRLLASEDGRCLSARLVRSAFPALGLALYLSICAAFRYRDVLTGSLARNFDLGAALGATARAPAWVLLPGLIGLPEQSSTIPGSIAVLATVLVVIGSLAASAKGRRPLLLGGIATILGGYFLAFATRAHSGEIWVVKISRYQLFPQLGLICMIAGSLGGFFRGLDVRPSRRWLIASLIAAVLACSHERGMRLAAEGEYRCPGQDRLFSAAVRLEEISRQRNITFEQLSHALDPVVTRWSPHPWPFHPILFLLHRDPSITPSIEDPKVRDAIISALDSEEREVIFGGMEATRYRRPISPGDLERAPTVARWIAGFRNSDLGDGRFQVEGWAGYLDFEVDPTADDASALSLPGLESDVPVEVCWAGISGPWEPARNVRWKSDPDASGMNWAVPINALPHWRRGTVRRLRIAIVKRGRMVVGSPIFLR